MSDPQIVCLALVLSPAAVGVVVGAHHALRTRSLIARLNRHPSGQPLAHHTTRRTR